ncbi:DUF4843 domain-containing protein [Pedobacter hiemivivus]|uniref:DUF4843 domain-containing protein n=2 Tax=Pedobacter hiemivivus TaxID=2530454 RepID=A0A4U1GIQ1_9SPHI|nr:DUF4843 domain-containing protein [Pedobacter hiemivivus]
MSFHCQTAKFHKEIELIKMKTMKRKILIAFLPLLACLWSCQKDIMEYQGSEGVYFAVQSGSASFDARNWPYQPDSEVEFVRINKDVVDFPVKVMITGPVKNYDRTFRVEVNPDSTTAVPNVHYDPIKEEWSIPANAVSINVVVRLKRTADLKVSGKTLGLRLVPTKDFSLSFPEWDAIPSLQQGRIVKEFDASLHTLRLGDIMVKPAVWVGSLTAANQETGSWGAFTQRKMEFLIKYLGVTYAEFASAETMPQVRWELIRADAVAVLIRLKEEGQPLLEEDGRLMWMSGVPWTSTLGVPYVK